MRWFWGHKEREEDFIRLDVRVHLSYRVGALAELITMITDRHAVIINFTAKGANQALGLGELYVDLVLAIRGRQNREGLLAEISTAGFSCEEIPVAEKWSI